MTAVGQTHTHDGIARFDKSKICRHVGLSAGVRLDIGVLRPEQLFSPLNGNGFYRIHIVTAAVITFAGITLSIFVG